MMDPRVKAAGDTTGRGSGARQNGSPSPLRLPLARALLRLGELGRCHLARDRVAVLDRGGAVARVGGGETRGGEVEPHMRRDDVLRHAFAARISEPELILRRRVAPLGGTAIPAR